MNTRHLIFIVNGNGVRKKDYYEDASISPNTRRIAEEGFVLTEYRYLNFSWSDTVPALMQELKPRILVLHDTTHDVGHDAYKEYLKAVKETDDKVGRLFNWVKRDPCFNSTTAIVLRPEFGRDDEVNRGQLHHSEGFYYAHRVASIFWGPDFNRGEDRKTVINRLDIAPTLAKLFKI